MQNKLNSTWSIILTFLLFITWQELALAQQDKAPNATDSTSNFSESDLAGKKPATKEEVKKDDKEQASKSSIIGSKNALANALLGNKITSLMYNDEEIGSVERAIDSLKNNQLYVPENKKSDDDAALKEAEAKKAEDEKKNNENEKSYLYLASIIYFSSRDWIVWVNDQKITPSNNNKTKELFIKSVKNDEVSLVWTMSISKWKILSGGKSEELAPKMNENNQVEVSFALKPNQTFVLNSNSVVEGKAVAALLRKKEEEKKEKIKK